MTPLVLVLAAIIATVLLARFFRRERPQTLNGSPWLARHFDEQEALRRKREADAATRGGR